MTELFGGKPHKTSNAIIKQEEGYLGKYLQTLNSGNTQVMVID